MASSNVYQHKKFDLKTEEYIHKKFGSRCNKRKSEKIEDKENITSQNLLDLAKQELQTEIPQAKRRQTKALFRPWLNEEDNKKEKLKPASQTSTVLTTISDNIPKSQQPRSSSKQQRVKRSISPAFIQRYNEQNIPLILTSEQIAFYQQYQWVMMQNQAATTLYLRHLQQMALLRQQQQQQLFVFGQQ